jgi:hypothetical protein
MAELQAAAAGRTLSRASTIDARLAICYDRLIFAVWRMRPVRLVFARRFME